MTLFSKPQSTTSTCSSCFAFVRQLRRGQEQSITRGVKKHIHDSPRRPSWTTENEKSLDITKLLLHQDPARSITDAYTRIGDLGAGSFGSVYSAKSKVTGEERAVKMIQKTEVKADMTYVVTEIEALIQLDHPNIVKFVEFFEQPDCICIVTELCACGDFGTLHRSRPTPSEIQPLFRDVMLGIAYCHDLGIAHRDLKFENCLISFPKGARRKTAKVIDFGLSGIRKERTASAALDDAWLEGALGTKFFISPEALERSGKYSVKCDIWSMGVMLYILLTREHPFAHRAQEMELETLFKLIRHARLRDGPLLACRLPTPVRSLVSKLLVRNPADRLDAAGALKEAWLRPADIRSDESLAAQVVEETLMQKIVRRLRGFTTTSRFEKVLLMMAAHHAKREQVEDMRDVFMSLSTGEGGCLSKDELRNALASSGHILAEDELEATFASLDANGNDKVDYIEWLSATMDPTIIGSSSIINALFSFFDTDGDDMISLDEIGSVVGRDEAQRVMKTSGCSDGCLRWEDFKSLVTRFVQARII